MYDEHKMYALVL